MADLKKAADELTAKAAFEAAKGAAERALEDALSTEEERAERKAREAAQAKRDRKKLLAMIVVGLLLLLGLIGMVVSYWQWFFLAGLVGVAALYGRYRWRKRRRAKVDAGKEPEAASRPAKESSDGSERAPRRSTPALGKGAERAGRAATPDRARARVADSAPQSRPVAPPADAGPDESIEDELAALKARLDK